MGQLSLYSHVLLLSLGVPPMRHRHESHSAISLTVKGRVIPVTKKFERCSAPQIWGGGVPFWLQVSSSDALHCVRGNQVKD